MSALKPFYICPVKLVATELHGAEWDYTRKKMAVLKTRFETENKKQPLAPKLSIVAQKEKLLIF